MKRFPKCLSLGIAFLFAASLTLTPFSHAEVEAQKNAWRKESQTDNFDKLNGPEKSGLTPSVCVDIISTEFDDRADGAGSRGSLGSGQNSAQASVGLASAGYQGSASVGPNRASVNVSGDISLIHADVKGQA